MNTITAEILTIENLENLNLLHAQTQRDKLTMMSLELNPSITQGSIVKLAIKPTNIMLANENSAIDATKLSCENMLNATITQIEKGTLLCSVTLEYLQNTFEAIITLNAANAMKLQEGQNVTMLIKASDLYIQEILPQGETL